MFDYSHSVGPYAQGDSELALRVLREKHHRTGHAPNAWHYGAVFLAFLNAGDEAGALAIQSEWRSLQSRDAAEQLGRSGNVVVAHGVLESVGDGVGDGSGDLVGGRARDRVGDHVGDRIGDRVRHRVEHGPSNDFRGGVGDSSDDSRTGQLLRGIVMKRGGGVNGFNYDGAVDDRRPPGLGGVPPSPSPVERKGKRVAGASVVAAVEAAGAPGDRFRPSDLLSLASTHADAGSWSECLDVLDTAQEVRSTRLAGGVSVRAVAMSIGFSVRSFVLRLFCFVLFWFRFYLRDLVFVSRLGFVYLVVVSVLCIDLWCGSGFG